MNFFHHSSLHSSHSSHLPCSSMRLGMNRRQFLGGAAAAGFFGANILSNLMSASQAQTHGGGQSNGYKALVCILLAGGCDSFNLLMPMSRAGQVAYQRARTNLAIDPSQTHQIRDAIANTSYGLHPATQNLQTLYNEKRLAFVANIGPLVQPTTKAQYRSGSALLPKGLLSHKDQIQHWQTTVPQDRSAKGVAGRINDRLPQSGPLSPNISLAGTNRFQYANTTAAYAITNRGSVGLDIFDSNDPDHQFVRQGVEAVLRQTDGDVFKQYYSETIFQAYENHLIFSQALKEAKSVTVSFPKSRLGQDLRMIANAIAAREALKAPQHIFFVNYGGWDHHDGLLTKQQTMLGDVADSLFAFDQALQQLELSNAVTTFTISDFGRTLTSNGNGSDHGWGGNIMVMGGDVQGGRIHGHYPDLTLDNDLDIGSGIFIPTLPTDALYGSLGRWFGLDDTRLAQVLPNLSRFPSSQQTIDLMRLA